MLLRPWRLRWAALREEVDAALATKPKAKALATLQSRVETFREALGGIQILDPACGSGNFLVVAMQRLLDLELEVVRFQAERFHTRALSFHVGPRQLHGIELLAFPHALASVVVWIGHLQWLRQHGYRTQERPILQKLQPIVQGDSLELEWPSVDAIIGNPPFIGSKRLRSALGDANVDALWKSWDGRVPREADYVCYWFEKAREAVISGKAKRVGLLATNSLRTGKNREILDRIGQGTSIYFAESDREWTLEGAAVRVSMVGFGTMTDGESRTLDGKEVPVINPDLTSGLDLSRAGRLAENAGMSFVGDQKSGPFEIDANLASTWLQAPTNPNGRPNSDVLKPWINGDDLVDRDQGRWIIDFGLGPNRPKSGGIPHELYLDEASASYYEAPFQYAVQHVKPAREGSGSAKRIPHWFLHIWPRPEMRRRVREIGRYLATVIHAKHRIFRWYDSSILPSHALVVIGSNSDAMFGLLHSRIHELWALVMGSALEDRPRYTPNTTFETFPFPAGWRASSENKSKSNESHGLTPMNSDKGQQALIRVHPSSSVANPFLPEVAEAARLLNEARERWLNPEGASEAELKKRTLTALYNEREAGRASWLNHLHRELDRAVLAAYGWSDLAGPLFAAEDALRAANPKGDALGLALGRTEAGQTLLGRLLALNLERAGRSGS